MSNYDYKSNKYDNHENRNRKTLWSSWSSDDDGDDDGDENTDWELSRWTIFIMMKLQIKK